MQYTIPPRTEESIGPSAPRYQRQSTFDPNLYQGDTKAGRRILQPKFAFISTGAVLLVMLCVVPVWNACALMGDDNYVFWVGRYTPALMLGISVGLIVLYMVVAFVFFNVTHSRVHTEQTVMMIANIFITLLGVILMLLSLALTRQSVETYTNLMHDCEHAEQSHRLFEYSQVLQNIRATPECAVKYSVEECNGYEDAVPYTSFLKSLESRFHCAGFCYRPSSTHVAQAVSFNVFGPAPGNSYCSGDFLSSVSAESMLECQDLCVNDEKCKYFSYWATGRSRWCHTTSACDSLEKDPQGQVVWIYSKQGQEASMDEAIPSSSKRVHFTQEDTDGVVALAGHKHKASSRRHTDHVTKLTSLLGSDSLSLLGASTEMNAAQPPNAVTGPVKALSYPPTLFSDANYQASCEGMAARDMKNFAGDVGSQTFYQGTYLVVIAIATGFLKLVGFCVRGDSLDKAR